MNGRLKKGQKLLAEYRRAAEAVRKEELRRHTMACTGGEPVPVLPDISIFFNDKVGQKGSHGMHGFFPVPEKRERISLPDTAGQKDPEQKDREKSGSPDPAPGIPRACRTVPTPQKSRWCHS